MSARSSIKSKFVQVGVAVSLVILGLGFASAPAAHAAATLPFTIRAQFNVTGGLTIFGNAVVTCDPSYEPCTSARNDKDITYYRGGVGWAKTVYVDADNDPSTYDSSMSTVTLPAGASVLWAGLYWGGSRFATETAGMNQMLFKLPDATQYQTIDADPEPNAQFGPDGLSYQRFADVTNLVQQAGAGDYWGANVASSASATTGSTSQGVGGWSMAVIYSAPGMPLRNLTVFDGFTLMKTPPPDTINLNGFQTPLTGEVNAQISAVAYEGDPGGNGDYMQLDSTRLSSTLSPSSDFFNSTNDLFGENNTARYPNDLNNFGFDIKNINVPGVLGNNQTSATVTLGTDNDWYEPGVIGTAIDLHAPDPSPSSKSVIDLNGNNPAEPGDTLRYTVNFVNGGQDNATDVVSTDQVPAGTQYVPGSLRLVDSNGNTTQTLTDQAGDDVGEVTNDTVTVRTGTGANATSGGTMLPGASQAYSFDVKVLDAAANTTVTNTAHFDFTGQTSHIPGTYDTDVVSTPVRSLADLSLTNTMTPGPLANGAPITSTLTITNNGPADSKDTVLTYPMATYNNVTWDTSAAPVGTACAMSGTTVRCTLPDMAPSATATIKVTGSLATDPSAPASTVTNTAQVSTTAIDRNMANNTATASVRMEPRADLSITKTASPTTVTPGNNVTYTLTATNAGPATARNVIVTDVMPASTNDVTNIVSATPSAGACTLPQETGISCQLGNLAAGASATVTVVTHVAPSATAGTAIDDTAQVTSDITGSVDTNMANNAATAEATVGQPISDLTMVKTVTPNPAVAGGPITYTLKAQNNGPSDSANVAITDNVPAGIAITNVTTDRGTCTTTGQAVNCAVGTLHTSSAAGPVNATVTIYGTVMEATPAGTVTNSATVQSDSGTPAGSGGTGQAGVQVNTSADLSVQTTATINGAVPADIPYEGDAVDYAVTVHNAGPSTATGVTMTTQLPAGLAIDNAGLALPAGVTCDAQANAVGQWNCTLPDIAVGQSVVINVPATTGTIATRQDMVTTINVNAATPDPTAANNTASWTLTPDPTADVSLVKTAVGSTFAAGDSAAYQLVVTNSGPADATFTVTDTLPDGLTLGTTDGTHTTTAGCTAAGQVVTCNDGTTLKGGQTATYWLVVNVSPDLREGAVLTNTAQVAPDQEDPSAANNESTATVTVTATSDVQLTGLTVLRYPGTNAVPAASDVITSTPAGSLVWVKMTMANNGLATADNPQFIFDPGQLPLVPVSSDGVHATTAWNTDTTPAANDPSCVIAGAEVTCEVAPTTMAPGGNATVYMLMQVPDTAPVTSGDVTGTATTVTPNADTQPSLTLPFAITAGTAALTVTKTLAPGTGPDGAQVAGTPFEYIIQVNQPRTQSQVNSGQFLADATDVELADTLPAGFAASGVNTTQGTCTIGSPSQRQVNCAIGTLPGTMDENSGDYVVTVTITGIVDPGLLGTGINNTATVTTSTPAPTGPFTASAAGDVVAQADLQMAASLDPNTPVDTEGNPVITAGSSVGLTLLATNAGPSNSGTANVTTTLPAGFALDTANSSTACTVTTPGDPETVTCAVDAIGPGASESFHLTATTSPTGEAGPVTLTATVNQEAVPDPDTANNTASVAATVQLDANLALTAHASPAATAGGTATYTTVVINDGPSVANSPTLTYEFPQGFTPTVWTVPNYVCTVSTAGTSTLTCQRDPATGQAVLMPGSAIAATVTVAVDDNVAAGNYDTTVTAATTTGATVTTPVTVQIDAVSSITAGKVLVGDGPLVVGQPATYQVTATNAGPSLAQGLVIGDTVPDGLTYSSATVPNGTCSQADETASGDANTVSCSVPSLAVGASATATFNFTVNTPAAGVTQVCNTADAGSESLNPAGDSATSQVCTPVAAVPTSTVADGEDTATVPEGGTHTFPTTISDGIVSAEVINAPAGSVVTPDITTGNVTFEAGTAAPGDYTFQVVWTDNLGQTTTTSYDVTVVASPEASVPDGEGTATVPEGGTHTFPTTLTGDIVSAEVVNAPVGSIVTPDITTGNVTFDAGTAAPGDYTFQVVWTDNLGQTTTTSYDVTVVASPEASVPDGEGTATIPEGGTHTFPTTISGDIVSAEVINAPEGSVVTPDITTGNVTFDAGTAAPGDYTFQVIWTDSHGQTTTTSYDVTVMATPPAPPTSTVPDGEGTATIPEGGTHTFPTTISGDIVSAEVIGAPDGSIVTPDITTGNVTFESGRAAPGDYTFQVIWTDSHGQTTTTSYDVTVVATPTSSVPDGEETATIPEGGTHTFPTNISGDIVSAEVVNAPEGSVVTPDITTGNVTFDAGTAAPGDYTFQVIWTDSHGQTTTTSYDVNVVVTPPAPPTSTVPDGEGSATIPEGGTHTFPTTISGDIVSAEVVGAPEGSVVTPDITTGNVTFDSGTAAPGDYTFQVVWTDSHGQTTTTSYDVTVMVTPPASPTSSVPDGQGTATIPEGGTHTFPTNISGDIVSAEVTGAPEGSIVTPDITTGNVTFDAGTAAAGDYTFQVVWTDSHGQTTTTSYEVTVVTSPTSSVPDGQSTATVPEGGSHTFPTTISGDIVSAEVVGAPEGSIVTTDITTGDVTFNAGTAAAGDYTFQVVWTDSHGQTTTTTYAVTVTVATPVVSPPATPPAQVVPIGGTIQVATGGVPAPANGLAMWLVAALTLAACGGTLLIKVRMERSRT